MNPFGFNASDILPTKIPTQIPTILTIAKALRFASTGTEGSVEAHNKTKDPSPNVVINAASKPPNERFSFL